MRRALRIQDVVDYGLCAGCGACNSAYPGQFEMVDVVEQGRRPVPVEGATGSSEMDARLVCPGVSLDRELQPTPDGALLDLEPAWGPVLGVWEGHAEDREMRWNASSGGAASALALYGIEVRGLSGVLHITSRRDNPILNETVLSTSRDELLAATGSRYAPASPCDRLDLIENAAGGCVFIGKPCDVAGVQKLRKLNPRLDRNVALTIAIFCAGTPSLEGTLEMLRIMGISEEKGLESVRYRGMGWPGKARVKTQSGREETLTYREAWDDILEKHRQWRCQICPDHSGEFADIAVGDPWYREIPEDEPGLSLIVPRTLLGQEFLKDAMEAGYIGAWELEPDLLQRSQPGFPPIKSAIWGRVMAMRLSGMCVPTFKGMSLGRLWLRLPFMGKVRSLLGTLRRIYRGRLWARASKRVSKNQERWTMKA